MPFGLPNDTVEQIRSVFARYPEVRQAILYGSRAMGTQRDGSDTDLTLTGKNLTIKVLSRIETELDDLLLPYGFDLSIRRQIQNDSLLNHIERVGILFYEREREGPEIHQGAAMKKGWQTKTLDQISTNLDSRRVPITKAVRLGGEYPYYGASGIVDYVADYIFDEDTLLISEDGANLLARSTSIAFPASGKYWVNNHAHILKFENLTTQRFVELYFESIPLDDYITGAAQPKLNQKALNSIPIPIPPLHEQHRIVGILDEAFEGIATAKANAEKNLQNARALFESHLQSVFSQRGKGWVEKKFDEVCAITSTLVDPKKKEFLDLTHVGAGNIESKTGVFIDLKTAREEGLISGKFLFDESMVLYSKIRPYLMKVARPDFAGLCSAHMYPLAPIPDAVTRDYLFHLLLSKHFTDYAIQGSARAGMPKVNREHLFEFRVWLPDVKKQKQLAGNFDELHEETQHLAAIYQQKLAALEALKKSLLHQAFSGEL